MSPGLVVPAVVFTIAGAPASMWVLRTRAHRRYAAVLPLALEQIAAHLRGGGTVGHGIAALAGGDALDVRPLFVRRDGELVPAGSPSRAPRRSDTADPDGRWFAC